MTTNHARLQRTRHVDQDTPTPARSELSTALAAPTSGRPIEPSVRTWLEAGFGHDFANVQVHADGEADALARSVQASAFTSGQDIYFRAGAYDPVSPDGQHRLAHEAAHVIQQDAGPVAGTVGNDGVAVSSPDDAFEQAAETAAETVVGGGAMAHSSRPASASTSEGGDGGEHNVQRFAGLEEVLDAPWTGGGGGGWEEVGGGGWEGGGGGGGGLAEVGESAGSWLGGLAGGMLGGPLLGGLGESAGGSLGGFVGGAAGGELDALSGIAGSVLGGLGGGMETVGGWLGGTDIGGVGESVGSSLGGLAGGLLGGPLLGDLGESAGSMVGGFLGGSAGTGLDVLAGAAGGVLGSVGGGLAELADLF
jgi:Domain of unknown function (DUF4157)